MRQNDEGQNSYIEYSISEGARQNTILYDYGLHLTSSQTSGRGMGAVDHSHPGDTTNRSLAPRGDASQTHPPRFSAPECRHTRCGFVGRSRVPGPYRICMYHRDHPPHPINDGQERLPWAARHEPLQLD
jgi:hypothetical protein